MSDTPAANWPRVPLGEVLTHRKEFITIDDTETYKRCRVQLHAQGVVLRDAVAGAEIKTKKQQVCRAGEFLVAEIDAKVGGFGIVPDDMAGAVVSSHYFLFEVNDAKLDRRFLDYFIRTPTFREQVEAQGSTNYAAIRPAHVLGYTIPLPPVAEQRRIAARVDAIADRVAEARRLREKAIDDTGGVLIAGLAEYIDEPDWPYVELADCLCEDTRNGIGTKPTDVPPGVQVLRISAGTSRQDWRVEEADHKFLPVPPESVSVYLLRPGDLLACRFNGNLHFVGRFALLPG